MALNLLSKLKEGSKFTPQGRIASSIHKLAKKLALGTGAIFGLAMMSMYNLGAAAFKGAIAGASIGASVGGVAGVVIGAQVGAAIGTVIIPIPGVGTVVGGTVGAALGGATGAFVGGTIGAVTGGMIGLGLSSGSATAVSMGVGAGVGGTIGAVAGYAAGAAAWGLVVGACAVVTGGTCAVLAVFTPAAGAVGSIAGAYIGTAIGAGAGYVFGEYVLEPAKHFFSGSQVKIRHVGEVTVSGTGNVLSNAWSGITGAIGGFGHSAMGWVSTGWNAALGVGGGLLSGAAGAVTGIVDGLGWGFGAISGTLAKVGVFGTVGATAAIGIFTGLGSASTLSDPKTDYVMPAAGDNEFFTLTKTANTSILQNSDLPKDIVFTIKLTAKQKKLSAVEITDKVTVTSVDGSFSPTPTTNTCTTAPSEIAAGNSWECRVVIYATGVPFLEVYYDSAVTNNVSASVTPEGETRFSDSATAIVQIGNAPAGCPHGWPATGPITQGPEGGYSHAAGSLAPGDPGYEAIDIGKGTVIGDPIYSTLDGTVVNIWQRNSLDQRVEVAPLNCPGLSIVAFWHNSSILVSEGQRVTFGQIIARSGSYISESGSAPHLHYQFNPSGDRSFLLRAPYIPDDSFPRTCSGNCNFTITTAP